MASTEDRKSTTRFTLAIGQRYDSLYLKDGTVSVEGFDIEFPSPPPRESSDGQGQRLIAGDQPYVAPGTLFTEIANNASFDIGEQAFSTYVQSVDLGKEITAIPVFPSRVFPHHEISVNAKSGIKRPPDLVGKRVGISFFSHNHVMWLRGVLQHQYGVPIDEIIWVETGKEHFAEYHPPARFKVEQALGTSATTLLENGEIDAALAVRGVRSKSPDVRPLFDNPYPEINEYLKTTPIYPINTVLTVPKATLKKSEELPEAVFKAFVRALDMYRDGVRNGTREDEHSGLYVRRLEQETTLVYPDYGLKANRQTIETGIRYCFEQGIIRKSYQPEGLFLLPDS